MENKALFLRTCDKDMKSHGGFVWPTTGNVTAPDWRATKECGYGLHGLKWGKGDWSLFSKSADAKWLVFEADESSAIDIDGKHKVQEANVVYCGNSKGAIAFILERLVIERKENVSSTTGYAAHSSTTGNDAHSSTTGYAAHSSTTGDYAHSSTTGDYAHSSTTGYAAHSSTTGYAAHSSTTGYAAHSSTTGNDAHSSTTGNDAHSSTTGYAAHSSTTGNAAHSSTTGDYAHSSTTGDYAHSSTTGNAAHSSTTGDYAHSSTTGYAAHSSTTGYDAVSACLGYNGKAKSSNGVLVMSYHDGKRRRVAVGYVGEGIDSDQWYSVNEHGEFIKTVV
jgi:hypothetical protein